MSDGTRLGSGEPNLTGRRGDAAAPGEAARSAYRNWSGAARSGRSGPVENTPWGSVWSYRSGIEPAAFPRTAWGHRGYEELSVDAFVEDVVRDREAADAQINDLRDEVDRLHRYIRRQWSAVAAAESSSAQRTGGPSGPTGLVSPAAQAQAVLSQAQEIADRRLAQADARLAEIQRQADDLLEHADRQIQIKLVDAERQAGGLIDAGQAAAAQRLSQADEMAEQLLIEARQHATERRARAEDDASRVLNSARSRYEDIVLRAHQRAGRAAEVALAEIQTPRTVPALDSVRVRAELEMKAAYLRTFAKASRAALQAALDVTAREFERLLGASEAARLGEEAGTHEGLAADGTDEPGIDEPGTDEPGAGEDREGRSFGEGNFCKITGDLFGSVPIGPVPIGIWSPEAASTEFAARSARSTENRSPDLDPADENHSRPAAFRLR